MGSVRIASPDVRLLKRPTIAREMTYFDRGVVVRAHAKHSFACERHIHEEMGERCEQESAVCSVAFHRTCEPREECPSADTTGDLREQELE